MYIFASYGNPVIYDLPMRGDSQVIYMHDLILGMIDK